MVVWEEQKKSEPFHRFHLLFISLHPHYTMQLWGENVSFLRNENTLFKTDINVPMYLVLIVFFVPLCRSVFPTGIIFLLPRRLTLTFIVVVYESFQHKGKNGKNRCVSL